MKRSRSIRFVFENFFISHLFSALSLVFRILCNLYIFFYPCESVAKLFLGACFGFKWARIGLTWACFGPIWAQMCTVWARIGLVWATRKHTKTPFGAQKRPSGPKISRFFAQKWPFANLVQRTQ